MMFRCPVCRERHSVPDRYDNKDYICVNGPSRINRKTFQNMKPDDILTRNEPLWNRSSTKEDVIRAASIINIVPEFRLTGEKIGQLEKNW